MVKKNIIGGNIKNSGRIHIGDVINNVFVDSEGDPVHITKAKYRQITKQSPFDLPKYYIPRTLTHLKAILEAKKYYFPEKEYRTLCDLIVEKQKIVLLGDAGMGKSTELKYLYNELLESKEDYFPVWISLNGHLLSDSLESYLGDLLTIEPERIVMIMDGYDEIPTTDHPQLNRQITNLILNRKDIRIILSSRKNTYDFDSESNTSKHEGFEIYYLNELSLNDIETYFESLGGVTRFSDFERELKRVNFLDVIKNPFYLKTIVELFLSEHTLPDSKGKLMYHCIERMTSWDDKRSTTIIYFDRYEVTRVIKKVAFAMEIMCRNTISNTDLRQILDNQEYSNLKYFGGFKKEDCKNDLWKFDHNNFQEFLAARALCHLGFDQILKIISFDPDYTVLNPSWLNTMSYLLSEIESKETLDKILLWLKTHNSHFLVNADPIRVQEDLRFEVFKNIFIEYEKNDQFLYSNHFTNEQLVAFVQDIDDVFIFLIEKGFVA